jgi:phosphate-selective porin OprO/OprP
MGRVMVHPLTWSGVQALQGLGLGIGGTYGNHQGGTSAADLTSGYVTFGQRTFFVYKSGVFADGQQWRINPQLMYYNGSIGALGEYVVNDQEVGVSTHTDNIRNDAWEGIAEYVLTGEDANFDGVTPAHNFDPKNNQWGAFELVGRVSQLTVDRTAFASALYADPTVSSREAFESTLGGTWYFSRAVKLNLDFSHTSFEGGFTGGVDHPDENAVFSRLQLRF